MDIANVHILDFFRIEHLRPTPPIMIYLAFRKTNAQPKGVWFSSSGNVSKYVGMNLEVQKKLNQHILIPMRTNLINIHELKIQSSTYHKRHIAFSHTQAILISK